MKLTEHDLRKSQFSHFLGKNITVQTTAAAVSYDTNERNTFVHHKTYGGVCEGFDEYGIWLIDPQMKTKAFYFYRHIQAIIEQPQVPEDHPLVQQALEKAKKEEKIREEHKAYELYSNQHFEPEPSLTDLSVDKLQKMLKERKI